MKHAIHMGLHPENELTAELQDVHRMGEEGREWEKNMALLVADLDTIEFVPSDAIDTSENDLTSPEVIFLIFYNFYNFYLRYGDIQIKNIRAWYFFCGGWIV